MRKIRVLLLFVVTVAVAALLGGVFASKASAIAWTDQPCPPGPDGVLKICKPDAEVGKSFSMQINAREGCTPDGVKYSLPNGSLPPGLTWTPSGFGVLISGTPTRAGEYRFWLSVADVPGQVSWCSDNHSADREFQLTVVQGLQIVQRQNTLAPAQLTTPYSLQLTATGGANLTWSVASGALPAGMTLNSSTGMLSGTPTQTGDFTFQVKVSDGSRTDVQTYTLSAVEKLALADIPAPAAEVGVPFELAAKATGGKGPYKWSATGLPSGLSIDAASGAISGTTTVAGLAPVKVTVTDALGLTTTADVKLVVAAKLALAAKALRQAKAGHLYAARLAASGGVRPLSWRVTGAPGLRVNPATGALSGTPRKAGTYRLKVQVTDKLGVRATGVLVLKVR